MGDAAAGLVVSGSQKGNSCYDAWDEKGKKNVILILLSKIDCNFEIQIQDTTKGIYVQTKTQNAPAITKGTSSSEIERSTYLTGRGPSWIFT